MLNKKSIRVVICSTLSTLMQVAYISACSVTATIDRIDTARKVAISAATETKQDQLSATQLAYQTALATKCNLDQTTRQQLFSMRDDAKAIDRVAKHHGSKAVAVETTAFEYQTPQTLGAYADSYLQLRIDTFDSDMQQIYARVCEQEFIAKSFDFAKKCPALNQALLAIHQDIFNCISHIETIKGNQSPEQAYMLLESIRHKAERLWLDYAPTTYIVTDPIFKFLHHVELAVLDALVHERTLSSRDLVQIAFAYENYLKIMEHYLDFLKTWPEGTLASLVHDHYNQPFLVRAYRSFCSGFVYTYRDLRNLEKLQKKYRKRLKNQVRINKTTDATALAHVNSVCTSVLQDCSRPDIIERYHARETALHKSMNQTDMQEKTYPVSKSIQRRLKTLLLKSDKLIHTCGNELQHVLHQEFLQHITTATQNSSALSDAQIQCAYIGLKCNATGDIANAWHISDFCYSLADWGTAAAKGVYEGAYDVWDCIRHPIDTSVAVAFNAGKLCYLLLKHSYERDLNVAIFLKNRRLGLVNMVKQSQETMHLLQSIIEAYEKTTAQRCIQTAARLATSSILTTKLLKSLGHMIQGTRLTAKPLSLEMLQKLRTTETQAARGIDLLLDLSWSEEASSYILQNLHNLIKKQSHELVPCFAGSLYPSEFSFTPNAATAAGLSLFNQYSKDAQSSGSGTILKVHNMKEFFQTKFGMQLKDKVRKTGEYYQGQPIYEVIAKIDHKYLKKDNLLYLDQLHKDHLEVFNDKGICQSVINLDGTFNTIKTAKAYGRRLP